MIKLCNIGESTQCLVQYRHSFKISSYVNPLMAHWLRFCTAMQGAWVQSLIGELRSHMPHGEAKRFFF